MNIDTIDILILHYTEKSATKSEIKQLWAWVNSKPENEAYFIEQSNAFYSSIGASAKFSASEHFAQVKAETDINGNSNHTVESKTQGVKIKNIHNFMSAIPWVAASIVVGTVLFLGITYEKNEHEKNIAKNTEDSEFLTVEPSKKHKTYTTYSEVNNTDSAHSQRIIALYGQMVSDTSKNKDTIKRTIEFDSTPLNEAIQKLQNEYSQNIEIKNKKLEEYLVNVSIENLTFQEVLQLFEDECNIQHSEQGGVVYLN